MLHHEPKWIDYEKAHPIIVPPDLEQAHPITRMTAAANGWQLPEPFDPKQLARHHGVTVDIRHVDPFRVLRLIDALLKAFEARGFVLRHEHADAGITVSVDGESFELMVSDDGGRAIRLTLRAGRYDRRNWNDTLSQPLERRLNNVMLWLRSTAAHRITSRREEEERERKIAEHERQRDDLRERIAREEEAVVRIHTDARDWQRAQSMRAYIAVVEAQSVRRKDRKKRAAWVTWAYQQADRLDPLTASPPSILDTPKRLYRELGDYEFVNEDGSIEHI
jgi:hypothetical protein